MPDEETIIHFVMLARVKKKQPMVIARLPVEKLVPRNRFVTTWSQMPLIARSAVALYRRAKVFHRLPENKLHCIRI